MWFIIVTILLAILIVFRVAGECYCCGSRTIIKYSKFKTKGYCVDCIDKPTIKNIK